MQTENRFFDDLTKVASSAVGVVSGLREEAESAFRARMEKILGSMDLVTREEFETVKEMAVKAREENEALKARLDALEKAKPATKAKSPAKPPTKASTKSTAKAKSTKPKAEQTKA